MRTVAIIQARTASTRLPGKALLDLVGEPMLARVVNRARRAGTLQDVTVATTTNTDDDAIAKLCAAQGWPCTRGSEDDLLDRYYRAAIYHQADVVVRLTSDCPLVEPEIIDRVVKEFGQKGPPDYASNTLPPRTFPVGLDVEVIAFNALERAWREDDNPAWREHVTPYIYRHPEKFRLHSITNRHDYSSMRWTVDTPDDMLFVSKIYAHFGHDRFSWRDVLKVLKEKPEWLEINRHVVQKQVP